MPHPLNPRLNLPKGIRDIVALVPAPTAMGGNALLPAGGSAGPAGPAGPTGAAGPGVAAGGTIHQVLTKLSSTNYDTDWETPAGSAHTHHWNEAPTGVVDGTNGIFGLASAPSPTSSLLLYRNGLLMLVGAGHDFTLAGATITFQTGNEPAPGAVLVASYTTT